MEHRKTFYSYEIEEIKQLINKKVVSSQNEQKKIRNEIRDTYGFYFSDFSNKKGYTSVDFEKLIDSGEITIIDRKRKYTANRQVNRKIDNSVLYYYVENKERKGPFNINELKKKGIQPKTYIWTKGLENWVFADSLKELKILFEKTAKLSKTNTKEANINPIKMDEKILLKKTTDQQEAITKESNIIPNINEGKFIENLDSSKLNTKHRYIPPSNQSENSQQDSYCRCPMCGLVLFIPIEIRKDSYIQCLNCGNTFRNPLKLSGNKLTSNQLGCLAVIAFLIFICIFAIVSSDDNSNSSSKIFDGQVKSYIKHDLKDPNSYQSMEWSRVDEMSSSGEYKYVVRHKYRAKNSFGGYVIENKIFYLDSDGNVVGSKDFDY